MLVVAGLSLRSILMIGLPRYLPIQDLPTNHVAITHGLLALADDSNPTAKF
jgi:hypothetical protein